jgi:hypothetical protein
LIFDLFQLLSGELGACETRISPHAQLGTRP